MSRAYDPQPFSNRAPTKSYRDNHARTFGKRDKPPPRPDHLRLVGLTEAPAVGEVRWGNGPGRVIVESVEDANTTFGYQIRHVRYLGYDGAASGTMRLVQFNRAWGYAR